MNNTVREALIITQEECAEVTQAIAKIMRFGFDSRYPEEAPTTRQNLEMEVGDLMAMIDILVDNDVIKQSQIDAARQRKKEKLKTWSNIFN